MNSDNPIDRFESLLTEAGSLELGVKAPSSLKARIYSALVRQQASSGPLLGLQECQNSGHGLCVFEHLVQITPVGERLNAKNICRVCHARVLAEHFDHAPIYWSHCPYVKFQEG
jgi:hypothetical protein